MPIDVKESGVSLMSLRSVTNVKSVAEPKLRDEESLDESFADIDSGDAVNECGWDRGAEGGRMGCGPWGCNKAGNCGCDGD